MSIAEALEKYCSSDVLPMHMPGHKRNTEKFPQLALLGAGLDITEIPGFDDLNNPTGMFLESESLAAKFSGSLRSIFLTGGATLGILASMLYALKGGGECLAARNCHKSVFSALEITGADASFVMPCMDRRRGIFTSVRPDDIENALRDNEKISLVVITSPTYEGIVSDIGAIADICHRHGAILLVDEAHGAHFGLGGFPRSAVKSGADIVVRSYHKTLSSLTQTAVLEICSDRIDSDELRRTVSMLSSSSPSYLLSASLDLCVRYLCENGERDANGWLSCLRELDNKSRALKRLELYIFPDDGEGIIKDPSKIIISDRFGEISGIELAEALRADYGIELEMSRPGYALAMTGLGDTPESVNRFYRAVSDLDDKLKPREGKAQDDIPVICLPQREMSIRRALSLDSVRAPLEAAIGKISAEYVFVTPPCVPIVIPGEVITADAVRLIRAGGGISSSSGGISDGLVKIAVEK